jgi:hypothetical protein
MRASCEADELVDLLCAEHAAPAGTVTSRTYHALRLALEERGVLAP